jgi:hypothetical protein
VIQTHAGIRHDQALIKINALGGDSQSNYLFNSDLAIANGNIPNATIEINPQIKTKLGVFKALTDKITDGRNLIFASCNPGVGQAGLDFGKNINDFTGDRLNILLPQDFVSPKYFASKGSEKDRGVWFSKMFHEKFLLTKPSGIAYNNVSVTLSAIINTPPVTVKK